MGNGAGRNSGAGQPDGLTETPGDNLGASLAYPVKGYAEKVGKEYGTLKNDRSQP